MRAARETETSVNNRFSVVVHALVGWVVCGATIGVGRQLVSMQATLIIHAVVAPVVFALLTWHYFTRFPESSPARTALAMLAIVVGLDALLVAPVFERSYAMFASILGTWVPFASIFTVSYLVGRTRRGTTRFETAARRGEVAT